MLTSGAQAGPMNTAQREPEIGRPIARLRENVAREQTLLEMLDQVVNRVCGNYPEKPVDPTQPPRPDNLVGVLDVIADNSETNLNRLGTLIDRLSSQV